MEDSTECKDEQANQDKSHLDYARQFLKELRAMPYNRDRVGQVSVIVSFKKPKNSEITPLDHLTNQ